jgi:hypothetical protein
MEVIRSSETSVDFKRITRRYISEITTLHNHRCENLKSCKVKDKTRESFRDLNSS